MPDSYSTTAGGCAAQRNSPGDDVDGDRFALYTREFSADPHAAYREMRRTHGPLAPVWLAERTPAYLVIGYRLALKILHDPEHFPADPRTWQQTVPEGCPVRPMMEYYPSPRTTEGWAHARYRQASITAIDAVDLHQLHETVARIAKPLIEGFTSRRGADLASEYAYPVMFQVLNEMIGCPPEVGHRAAVGTAQRFDTVNANEGMGVLKQALEELIVTKRTTPGDDITSRLVEHPTGLNDEEVLAQLMSMYGAGIEAGRNFILNTILRMLVDEHLGDELRSGSMSTRDGLDAVLFEDPPMANFCISYPQQPRLIAETGTWLPAHQPVVISLAACNNDPEIRGGDLTGNRSHLAWGAGSHACPARAVAYQIAQDAIDELLDWFPDMKLDKPVADLKFRPGPFHRALSELHVRWEG